MDEVAAAEVVEEVLAVGLDPFEHPLVEPGGGVGEASLRRGDGHDLAGEVAAVVEGEAVDRVTFGHDADECGPG